MLSATLFFQRLNWIHRFLFIFKLVILRILFIYKVTNTWIPKDVPYKYKFLKLLKFRSETGSHLLLDFDASELGSYILIFDVTITYDYLEYDLIQLFFFILFCLNEYINFLTSGLRELHDPSSSERGHGGKTRLEWHRAGIDWIVEAISHRLIINNFYITWKITKITLTLHVTFESFKIKLSFSF